VQLLTNVGELPAHDRQFVLLPLKLIRTNTYLGMSLPLGSFGLPQNKFAPIEVRTPFGGFPFLKLQPLLKHVADLALFTIFPLRLLDLESTGCQGHSKCIKLTPFRRQFAGRARILCRAPAWSRIRTASKEAYKDVVISQPDAIAVGKLRGRYWLPIERQRIHGRESAKISSNGIPYDHAKDGRQVAAGQAQVASGHRSDEKTGVSDLVFRGLAASQSHLQTDCGVDGFAGASA
jgi:hypothetical protein